MCICILYYIVLYLYNLKVKVKNIMTIPNKITEKWKLLRSKGDIALLANKAKVTTVTIRTAMKDNECSDEVFKVIADFYEERAQLIKQYI